jgi:hypothetical protein
MKPSRVLIGSLALLLAIAILPANLTAHHRWGKYHWARATNPLFLTIADNVDSSWNTHLTASIGDWNQSAVLDFGIINGGKDPVSCPPTLGRVDVCNAAYGDNGWLGIAQIWIAAGSHITQGTTKLNDTYFNTPAYNTSAWRRLVVCQEVGHTFGLDHQDERFTNTNLGTCMDYTNDPDGSIYGQLSNVSPNAHDYEELASIYAHLDTTGGGGPGRGRQGLPGAFPTLPPQAQGRPGGNDQRAWGQLVAANGRLARYELDLGNGNFVYTFVIWA